MYELMEHTADIGLRVRAGEANELFAEAARGFSALLVDNLTDVRPLETRRIQLEAGDTIDLFHDWLAELLYLFQVERMIFCQFQVQLEGKRLEAEMAGEHIDSTRHRLDFDIKAVTYHGLKVEPESGGWLAEVIVDI